MSQAATRLRALIVGINAYTRVRPLRGAVADAKKVRDYFDSDEVKAQFPNGVELRTLFDREATKKAIVTELQDFLGGAKADDVCVFFFAGHGVREKTTVPAFHEAEMDGSIGAIAAVDTNLRPGPGKSNNLIADKEMRYLLHKIAETGAEIVVLYDCCHSGGATRDLSLEAPENSRQIVKSSVGERDWSTFIFSDEMERDRFDDASGAVLESLLPTGRHIHFAACREVELAYEEPPEAAVRSGVFTHNLLTLLQQHRGNISYTEIQKRLYQQMRRAGKKDQNPQVYYAQVPPADRHRNFLTGAPLETPLYAPVAFDQQAQRLRVERGMLHGISPGDTLRLSPVGEDNPESFEATVAEIFPGHSLLEARAELDAAQRYRATTTGSALKPLFVYLDAQSGSTDEINRVQTWLTHDNDSRWRPVQTEDEADITLRLDRGDVLITRSFDRKPLTESLPIGDSGSAHELHRYLTQMAQWEFLRELEHQPQGAGDKPPVRLRFFRETEGGEEELTVHHGKLIMELNQHSTPQAQFPDRGNLRIEMENTSDQDWYCGLFYLGSDFSVYVDTLERENTWLKPEDRPLKTKMINGKPYIPQGFGAHIYRDKWPGESFYFKVVLAQQQFQPHEFAMNGLPAPEDRSRQMRSSRGALSFGQPQSVAPSNLTPQWWIYTVEVYTPNPKENIVV